MEVVVQREQQSSMRVPDPNAGGDGMPPETSEGNNIKQSDDLPKSDEPKAPVNLHRGQTDFFFFAELIRDSMQTFGMYYTSFEQPESFKEWFGEIAPWISLDFATIFGTILQIDIVLIFY